MSKLSKTLETVTNIAVIVVFFIVVGFFYKTYRDNQPLAPGVGDKLPQVTGYNWQSSPHSLLLVLKKGCHFCEESMPFYRALHELEKSDRLDAKMVAIFPDRTEDVAEILRTQNLPIPGIPETNISSLKVSGTPTLILVDQNGTVEKAWVGKQGYSGENSILTALRKH
jgi:hypothetical protein